MNAPVRHLRDRGQGAHAPTAALARVLARLPDDIRGGFTQDQLAALDGALDLNNPTRHAVNLRVTLFGFAYLVVLAGRERRSRGRRADERKRHPLRSPGNLAFLLGVAVLGLALGGALRLLLFGG